MTTLSAEIWSLKASGGRISACAWLCKFSATLVLCWLLCFSFISIMKSIVEQIIIVRVLVFIYLFSVVLNISNVFHWKLFHICWVQISCKILVDQPRPQGFSLKKVFEGKALGTRLLVNTVPHLHLMVCFSFIPRLWSTWSIPWFRATWATFIEREKIKMNNFNLNGKTFQINL